jgi:hypothetical protein
MDLRRRLLEEQSLNLLETPQWWCERAR